MRLTSHGGSAAAVRVLLYGLVIAAVGWSAYELAHGNSGGAHAVDSEADLAMFEGLVWAAGMSAIALLVCAVVEGIMWWRRSEMLSI